MDGYLIFAIQLKLLVREAGLLEVALRTSTVNTSYSRRAQELAHLEAMFERLVA
jgi:hypothetical protein